MNTFTSSNPVYGRTFLNTLLAALAARPAAALIAAGKVRLSKDPGFNPNAGSSVAGLAANEADFSGYTAGGYTLTVGSPANLTLNIQGALASVTPEAAAASPFVPNSVYGYWIDDGTNMVMAEAFGPVGPASFSAPGDFLQLDLRLPLALRQAAV